MSAARRLSPGRRPLRRFFGEYRNDRGAVMAGSTLITVAVMGFFVIVHRRLSTGLVAGAVKG